MGISYAPFDSEPITKPPVYDPLKLGQAKQGIIQGPGRTIMDSTECNWIVLFFVMGVFLLALTDTPSLRNK